MNKNRLALMLFAALGGIATALLSIPHDKVMVNSTVKGLAEDEDFKAEVAREIIKEQNKIKLETED